MSHIDPHSAFPEFYRNPIIGAIANARRWTVSDSEKVPINMRELINTGRIWGAHEISDQCLVTLDELTSALPDAANNAFYLRAQTDGFMVLDIEKTCPPEISSRLLSLPSMYRELSMSGKGHHLIMPLPSNFWDFPIAAGKAVLKESHGYYEILLDHWVTFTRRTPPTPPSSRIAKQITWEEVYASLASEAVEAPTSQFDITAERPEIVRLDQILELMTRRPLEKTLADFHDDHSRYEFSTLGSLYNRLKTILIAIQSAEPDAVYDESAMSWLLYEAASAMLPHREKHDELRNGMPLLLNAAVSLVARRLGSEQAERGKS